MRINREGYLVRVSVDDVDASGYRSYACTDRNAVNFLIEQVFGRSPDTFPQDARGLPTSPALRVTYPFHIYGGPTDAERFAAGVASSMPESEYKTEVTGAPPHTGR